MKGVQIFVGTLVSAREGWLRNASGMEFRESNNSQSAEFGMKSRAAGVPHKLACTHLFSDLISSSELCDLVIKLLGFVGRYRRGRYKDRRWPGQLNKCVSLLSA